MSPVPPSIKESKFKGIPVDGVVMDIPAISEAVERRFVCEATGNEVGLDGFGCTEGAGIESIGLFAGGSKSVSSRSCFTSINCGFMSGGLTLRSGREVRLTTKLALG